MTRPVLTLAVGRAPFHHQARALTQLARDVEFLLVDWAACPELMRYAAQGPFIALTGADRSVPLLGLTPIVEWLHREFPKRGYLPSKALERARARAFAQIIEQRFSYLFMAKAAWERTSVRGPRDTGSRILETPPPLSSIAAHQDRWSNRFLAGDRASLADCLLAALWWSSEDADVAGELNGQKSLERWYQQNAQGEPFSRS